MSTFEKFIYEYEMIDKVFVPFRIFAPWPLLGCQGRMEGSIVARERVADTLVGHIATLLHCCSAFATLLDCYIATMHCPPFWAAIAQVAGYWWKNNGDDIWQ